jgi:hypothetical protein
MMTWLGWWLFKFVCWATNSLGSPSSKQQPNEMVSSLGSKRQLDEMVSSLGSSE